MCILVVEPKFIDIPESMCSFPVWISDGSVTGDEILAVFSGL